jgi:hypothetical protein
MQRNKVRERVVALQLASAPCTSRRPVRETTHHVAAHPVHGTQRSPGAVDWTHETSWSIRLAVRPPRGRIAPRPWYAV